MDASWSSNLCAFHLAGYTDMRNHAVAIVHPAVRVDVKKASYNITIDSKKCFGARLSFKFRHKKLMCSN